MKHLFIINPKARRLKGRADSLIKNIKDFFSATPAVQYFIHITRWKRDAEGFTRRYVSSCGEIVRVYAIGGTGTLFEILNGTIGLPNVQITLYPAGISNTLLHYFGKEKVELFRSLRNLVFSRITAIDAIRCRNNYALCYLMVGAEAMAARSGSLITNKTGFSARFIYLLFAIYHSMQKKTAQAYTVTIDGKAYDGTYLAIGVANQPCYGMEMYPAIDAKPDDGMLDIYFIRPAAPIKLLKLALDYAKGRYYAWPNHIFHCRGRSISISSSRDMRICLDGEMLVDSRIHCEVAPGAVDFACPPGINPKEPPDWTREMRSWNYWKRRKTPHQEEEI